MYFDYLKYRIRFQKLSLNLDNNTSSGNLTNVKANETLNNSILLNNSNQLASNNQINNNSNISNITNITNIANIVNITNVTIVSNSSNITKNLDNLSNPQINGINNKK